MELRQMVIIILQITNVISKRRIKVSEDSIENVLYYKDCNHKPAATEPPNYRKTQPPQQECKMCCTMCCGDQCVNNQHPSPQRTVQMDIPTQGQPMNSLMLSRKNFPGKSPQAPSRRDFNTRDYIKKLISHDGDIRTILKDLVRVTMQKVDLMKKMDVGNKNAKESLEESKDYEPDL